ncbi:MAG: 3'-5' exonuclease [Candidatus Hydrogenedens sp.]|nr:3'-5' exonuclease [Candidatus Hydrogenedens sp.]
MHKHDEWVVVSAEISGLTPPVYAIEIAAQRMQGWRAYGEPFHMLLNHRVDIDPAAKALHGYSRTYLNEHGLNPLYVHRQLRKYAGSRPVAVHNLGFFWKGVLQPERAKLRLSEWDTPGLCTMALARRLISEAKSHKLPALVKAFHSTEKEQKSRALEEMQALIKLMRHVFRERLNALGLIGFEEICAWSQRCPTASCREATAVAMKAPKEWYVLAEGKRRVGPYYLRYLAALAEEDNWLISRRGSKEWLPSQEVPEFQQALEENSRLFPKEDTKEATDTPKIFLGTDAALSSEPLFPKLKGGLEKEKEEESFKPKAMVYELIGLLKGLTADGDLNAQELRLLRNWIEQCPYPDNSPVAHLKNALNYISDEEEIDVEEKDELLTIIQDILAAFE